MYLSQLDIIGFKSFAQKTKFKFNRGISAIVGPNGCGKTNVVDAIRWVLGEQKSAVLRSEVMDNVIFNGTKTRKPLSMAEVSLLIINDRGILPSDYNEILITRRIYKDGETEYLINNTKCRLKDILELFMDTGMSSNSYSVIELKMVEAILSGRPEERRQLIEEAAGVNKYKQRRKEATRKLQNIQLDLHRINDLVLVIEKNVNSLMRQASKTKRYNKLMERHKELESAIIVNDYNIFQNEKNQFEEELKNKNIEKSEHNEQLELLQIDYESLLKRIDANNIEIQKVKDKEININSIISNMTQEYAVSKEKLNSLINNLSKISEYNEEYKLKLDILKERDIELDNLLNNSENENKSILENLNSLNEKKKISKANYDEIKDKIQLINNSLYTLKNNIANTKINIEKNINKKTNFAKTIANVNNDIDILNKEIVIIDKNIDNNTKSLDENSDILKIKQNELTNSQKIKDDLKHSLDDLKLHLTEFQNNISSKNASLAYLNSLSDKDENTNYLMENKNWNLNYDKNILIESVSTDEKYRIAIESIIGEFKNAFLVDDINDTNQAIENLRKSKKGKSTFIINKNNNIKSNLKKLPEQNGIFGFAIELIEAEDNIKYFLSNYLSDSIIVENLDTAKYAIENDLASKAVTLSGEILSKYGLLKAGGILNNEGQIVGKNDRIKKLKKEISLINEEISKKNIQLNEITQKYNNIDIFKISNEIKSYEKKIQEITNLINQNKNKKDAIKHNIEAYQNNSIRYTQEQNELELELNELNNLLLNYEAENKQNQSKLNDFKNDFEAKELILKTDENKYYQAELDKIKFEAKVNSTKEEKNRNKIENININNKISAYEQERIDINNNINSLKSSILNFENDIKIKNEEKITLENKLIDFVSEKNGLNDEATQFKNEINIKRQFIEKTSETIHKLDIKYSEVITNIKNLTNRAIDILNIDTENDFNINNFDLEKYFNSEIELPSISEAKAELKDIREKLNQLGSVNFLALQQFEEESDKQKFYNKQLNDLNESEKILKETINEINTTAEKKFQDTFDQVNENFQMLFKKLFSAEADSHLELKGDNLLESDIEIIARPPGKKPHSIDLLSQGEKTLTAIALLFGIYLVKPSPFCILDEVDAPLDDKNIDRFLGMLKQFSNDTQFLIVTHNKSTMTAADTLYGVTMQEDGVSKVVSVKFDKSDENL